MGRLPARREGLWAGIPSGAMLFAACQAAKRAENAEEWSAALLPDTGERHLSIALFTE